MSEAERKFLYYQNYLEYTKYINIRLDGKTYYRYQIYIQYKLKGKGKSCRWCIDNDKQM